MKIVGVKEFRDNATMLLRGKEPVLITRHGRPAGIYAPLDGGELPLELREELFRLVTERVRQSLGGARGQ